MKFSLGKNNKPKNRWRRIAVISLIIIAALVSAALIGARIWYDQNLKPLTTESRIITVEIPFNSSVSSISKLLKTKGVIRNTRVFEIYVRNHGYSDDLLAGVYDFNSGYQIRAPINAADTKAAIIINEITAILRHRFFGLLFLPSENFII
jgi:cell division protein YceG involved in septum cleavage